MSGKDPNTSCSYSSAIGLGQDVFQKVTVSLGNSTGDPFISVQWTKIYFSTSDRSSELFPIHFLLRIYSAFAFSN